MLILALCFFCAAPTELQANGAGMRDPEERPTIVSLVLLWRIQIPVSTLGKIQKS